MTIKDIARESGYAVSTVSRALNNHPDVSEEAKQKIKAIVEAHRFIPNNNAKQLKQQATTNIAIVVKGTHNMLFAAIVEQMQPLIKRAGYTAAVHYLDEDDDEVLQALQLCRERKPLGVLFLGGHLDNFSKNFGQITIPSVLVTNSGESLRFENLSSVSTDDRAAAARAVEYLLEQGHRRIGVIGGNREKSCISFERYLGIQEVFARRGVAFTEAAQSQKARFSYDSAYRAMGRLLETMPEITAVFTMSDVMAIGAIRYLRDRGISVPNDISVMGFDGVEVGEYYNPKLATIRQSQEQLANRSVEILVQQIEELSAPVHEIVPFALSEGESVAQCERKKHT